MQRSTQCFQRYKISCRSIVSFFYTKCHEILLNPDYERRKTHAEEIDKINVKGWQGKDGMLQEAINSASITEHCLET